MFKKLKERRALRADQKLTNIASTTAAQIVSYPYFNYGVSYPYFNDGERATLDFAVVVGDGRGCLHVDFAAMPSRRAKARASRRARRFAEYFQEKSPHMWGYIWTVAELSGGYVMLASTSE